MDKRISTAAIAILATLVMACGSTGAGSAGKVEAGGGNPGNVYLTADDRNGVNAAQHSDGAAGSISDPARGPVFQP